MAGCSPAAWPDEVCTTAASSTLAIEAGFCGAARSRPASVRAELFKLPQRAGRLRAMHMRLRAGLGDADYKALRRFLNP
jgi:hypothetical protein